LDQDCQIAISVRDSGIGMSADTMQRLFQKFEQADASTARTYGGTGLGLAICKRIVDAMGGSIKVASKLQVGTTFSVCLPLTPGVARADMVCQSVTQNHPWQLSILCAEDGATNQVIVRDLVESMGHTIHIVENGKLALDALASHDYDLVLMDSRMPEMDGLEALSLLRQGAHQVRDAQIPVIAVTANVSQAEREVFFERGADGFIGKPIHEADLRDAIGRVINTLIQRGKPLRPQAGTTDPKPAASAPAPVAVAKPSNHPLLAFGPAARQNLIAMYLVEAPRLLQLAREQLAANDAPALAMTAHSLKGCSGYFDTGEFTQICRTLEMAAKAQDWDQIRQAFPPFETRAMQVIEETRTLSFD
jgi:CheY-like chemotaxis protein/HPt (histidine-containing phosphotransfer) domain-containing protein